MGCRVRFSDARLREAMRQGLATHEAVYGTEVGQKRSGVMLSAERGLPDVASSVSPLHGAGAPRRLQAGGSRLEPPEQRMCAVPVSIREDIFAVTIPLNRYSRPQASIDGDVHAWFLVRGCAIEDPSQSVSLFGRAQVQFTGPQPSVALQVESSGQLRSLETAHGQLVGEAQGSLRVSLAAERWPIAKSAECKSQASYGLISCDPALVGYTRFDSDGEADRHRRSSDASGKDTSQRGEGAGGVSGATAPEDGRQETGLPNSSSVKLEVTDPAIEFACPGQTTGLTLQYKRMSFTPIAFIMPPGSKKPCGVVKLSCRLRRGEGLPPRVVVKDRGEGMNRKPFSDVVWGEVVSANMLKLVNSSFPAHMFGTGVVIPPSSPLFSNCENNAQGEGPACLQSIDDIPSPSCGWSGNLMGYLMRFHTNLREARFTPQTYRYIEKDPISLESFALTLLMDSINLKVDRNALRNLFRIGKHYVPMDMEGLVVSELHLNLSQSRAMHPNFLLLSGLKPRDLGTLFEEAGRWAVLLCGVRTGPCEALRVPLEDRLRQDPFLQELEKSVSRIPDSTSVLCPLISGGNRLIRNFQTCCPVQPESERKKCLALQYDLPSSVLSLGTSIPEVLARLVTMRLAAVRDRLLRETQGG